MGHGPWALSTGWGRQRQCRSQVGDLPPSLPGKKANIFRVEAVEKCVALEWGKVAGIWQQSQLLVEDMEEVEMELVAK